MSYIERIRGPQQAKVVPINGATTKRDRSEGLHPYAAAIRKAWTDRLDALASRPWQHGDAWDTNCFASARKFIELANSTWTGYDLTDARQDYLAHAPHDSRWDQREKCWAQAVEYSGQDTLPEPAAREEWSAPDVTVLDQAVRELGEDLMEHDDAAEATPLIYPRLDWHALWAEPEDEEWILEPLVPVGRLVALFSAPKAGKSLLMLELAVAIANGTKALGATLSRPFRVLYVDFENDPRGDVRTRLDAMDYGPDDLDNLVYLSFPSLAKLDTPMGAADLLRHVEHYSCEVVVIDTISRAVGGEENDNDTWLNFYRWTGVALKRNGVACIRLDHTGKDHEKGMRGGSAKYGDVDAVWKLSAVSTDTVKLVCTDKRFTLTDDEIVLRRTAWPTRHDVITEGWKTLLDDKARAVEAELDRLGLPNNIAERPAGKALREAGHKVENKALRDAVRARKLRVDTPGNHAPPAHSGASGASSKSAPGAGPPIGGPRRIAGGAPESAPEGGPDEEPGRPIFQVACKSCYTPIHRDDAISGRCAKCARAAGLTDTEGDPA